MKDKDKGSIQFKFSSKSFFSSLKENFARLHGTYLTYTLFNTKGLFNSL